MYLSKRQTKAKRYISFYEKTYYCGRNREFEVQKWLGCQYGARGDGNSTGRQVLLPLPMDVVYGVQFPPRELW